jgi:hypothetical protein
MREMGIPDSAIKAGLEAADGEVPTGATEASMIVPAGREREVIELMKSRRREDADKAYDICNPAVGEHSGN